MSGLFARLGAERWSSRAKAWLRDRSAPRTTPIVPPGSFTGHALTVVIAIMCFLACLTAGAVHMLHQSASAWYDDIASEITIQISPTKNTSLEKQVTLVSLFLAKQPGIREVRPLTAEDSAQLLEPWLGTSEALSALPIPRLISVEIDRSSPPDLAAIGQALEQNFPAAKLDDHRRWQAQIRTLIGSLALGGIAVLLMVAAATVATIVSATRSAMASNREIIEVLHFVGAKKTFIAREFEKHFLVLGIRAGLVGAVAATAVFILLPVLMRLLSGGTLAGPEFKRLIGPATLDVTGYMLFVLVVVVIAALCMLTSRHGVHRILKLHE